MNFTGVTMTGLRIALFLMLLHIINTDQIRPSFLLTVSTTFHHDFSWSEHNIAQHLLFG